MSEELMPDKNGRFGIYGGRYVAETLVPALEELSEQYEEIKKKMELGVSDLTKLNLEKFIFDNPSATFAYPDYAKLFASEKILKFVTVLRGLLENTQKLMLLFHPVHLVYFQQKYTPNVKIQHEL